MNGTHLPTTCCVCGGTECLGMYKIRLEVHVCGLCVPWDSADKPLTIEEIEKMKKEIKERRP